MYLKRLIDSGVSQVIIPNIDKDSIGHLLALHEFYPEMMLPALGLHPCHVFSDYQSDLKAIKSQIENSSNKIMAVGEAGLDYFHDTTYVDEQKIALNTQINWALDFDIPIIIHCRNAFEDAISIMEKRQNGRLKGVFHCFTGTAAESQRVTDSGFYLGIGGVITYPKSGLYEEVASFNKDFVILETDSPYLPPVPFRGKRNESTYLPYINEKLATAWRMTAEESAAITTLNAQKLFSLD
jgi:TatD DNase family protein